MIPYILEAATSAAEKTSASEKTPMWNIAEKGDYGNVLLISLFCIAIVFVILILITLILDGINKIPALDEKEKVKMKDGTVLDEDALAAVLVATIDYRKERKEDVKVISVKLIEDDKDKKKKKK